jgi:hypothetical protein
MPGSTIEARLDWRLLVPGAMQRRWGQRERASALGIMFGSGCAMSVFGWGTWAACVFILLALAVHVTSIADALRQRAFPEFAGGVPTFSTLLVVGTTVYVPLIALAWHLAWPAQRRGDPGEQYLVDRGAYAARDPAVGDRVCFQTGDDRGFDLGRVVAMPGDEVEWAEGQWRINGRRMERWNAGPGSHVRALRIKVPESQWLVGVEDAEDDRRGGAGLMLVARGEIVGRPWAQSLPLRQRRLLL